MKKLIIFILLCNCWRGSAQIINFTDANLKTKLLQSDVGQLIAANLSGAYFKIDANNDGEIDQAEALTVGKLIIDNAGVNSVTDLQYFTNLKQLFCRYNNITTIYLPTLTQLTYLDFSENNITQVNFSGLSNITNIWLVNNQLTEIDVSSLQNLITLRCNHNFLTSLDVSQNIELQNLGYAYNSISTINLHNNIYLRQLACDGNQITTLDISNNLELRWLTCTQNQISSLDFSTMPYFDKLRCSNNNLSYINIQNGINQNSTPVFTTYNDCWKDGNPNLTTVCADATEVASVQAFLNSCGSSSQTVTVTSSCSMATETAVVNSFTITPNPSSGVFTMAFETATLPLAVTVYNVLGQEVMSLNCARDDNNVIIDLTGYPSGVYLMVIKTEQGIVKERIIKN